MRHFLTILSHEIRMLLVSPSTYIAGVLFLIVMGFMFTSLLEDYSRGPMEISPAGAFFAIFPLPVLFMVPLLTMKSISEERKNGTLETLLTTPVTTFEVILGKFGAAYFLYILLWASTAAFFYLLRRFAGDFDPGPLIGGYLFIAVSGLFFIAAGIFASSLSRNQAVAGILCFTILFLLLLGTHFAHDLEALNHPAMAPVKTSIEYAQVLQHLNDFSRGIVDVRQLLFYVSGSVLCLIFSILGVEAKLIHS
ncbi:MAG: ABC transporter permease [Nibricoccus sp.]